MSGCSRQATDDLRAGSASEYDEIINYTPAAERKPDAVTNRGREFFVDWLGKHGHESVIDDETGVGIADNATRLWSFLYDVSGDDAEGYVAEVEFRIVLPDGREIIEFVAGAGSTSDDAIGMTFVNFTLSTFHVVYAGFMDTADQHVSRKQVTVNGKPWTITSAGMMTFGGDDVGDFGGIDEAFFKAISEETLSDKIHWGKLVYGRSSDQILECSVTVDNLISQELSTEMRAAPWPATAKYYLAKQFIVLQPGNH
ncbi:DUF6348 family protein [Stieleria varia]|nr:DUF6348 family protein [Stieleria varia]